MFAGLGFMLFMPRIELSTLSLKFIVRPGEDHLITTTVLQLQTNFTGPNETQAVYLVLLAYLVASDDCSQVCPRNLPKS